MLICFDNNTFGPEIDGENFVRTTTPVEQLCLLVSYTCLVMCHGRLAIVLHWFVSLSLVPLI